MTKLRAVSILQDFELPKIGRIWRKPYQTPFSMYWLIRWIKNVVSRVKLRIPVYQ